MNPDLGMLQPLGPQMGLEHAQSLAISEGTHYLELFYAASSCGL